MVVAPAAKRVDSTPKPAPTAKKEVAFEYPEWLVNMAIENSKKTGIPLDCLAKKVKELGLSEDADPFCGKRRRSEDEDGDLMNQLREMRRQAKLERRKTAAVKDDEGPELEEGEVAESSAMGAAHNQGASTKSTVIDSMPKTSRKSSAKPSGEPSNSPFVPEVKESEHTPLDLPDWYKNIKNTSQAMKQLSKRPSSDQTQALIALQSMKGCMDRCEKEGVTPAQLAKLFEELRDHVHKAEILLKVDRLVVRKAKMLEEATGLPRIFAAKRVDFPWDLKADAFQLYNRWRMQVFELDILRGIRARPGTDRGADSIDPTWPYRVSAKFYGEGNLVLGQWWPTQLTTVRDGAHGSPQAGIFGEKGMGAYSVVLSGTGSSYYNDEDNGNDIWYSGTDGQNFTPTDNTNRLIETCDTLHNPVRVLRSHNLPNSNPYRPEVGFRYDGLYDVVEKKLVHAAKQKYKFHLVRCKGQFPIRCEDNAARRPTRFEIAEDDRLRKSGR